MDSTKVRVGVTGAVYVAPSGTALPDDAATPLPSEHDDVGFISDDGVTESHDEDTNDIQGWQNGAVVRKVQTSHDLTYNFTMIETSEVTLREYYGNYTPAGAENDATVKMRGGQLPRRVWVLSVEDGDHTLRVVIPDGQVTERGDITYANSEAVGREVTITCYPVEDPDDPTQQVKAIVYLDEANGQEI